MEGKSLPDRLEVCCPFPRCGDIICAMAEQFIQILDSEGEVRDESDLPDLNPERLVQLYRLMLLNRRVDERMVTLQRQGRIGFYVGSIGEEAAIIGSAAALQDNDWILPCYRELGAAMLRGFTVYELCCQLFGTRDDATKGRQMPNHYALPELRYASVSSPVGTQIPHATGVALAAKITGNRDAVLVYFGDGATSTGDFHAAANLAGAKKAPVVFLCRNNQWAISIPVERQTAAESLAAKAQAYGFKGVRVDGNDLLAVYQETSLALEHARNGGGPTLIEAFTYRLAGHSTSDDPRAYRDEEQVQVWQDRDPLKRLRAYLTARGVWDEKQEQELEAETRDRIMTAVRKAEAVGPPALETLFTDVYDEVPWNLKEQQEELERSRQSSPVKQKV